jgi:hypothetical protein
MTQSPTEQAEELLRGLPERLDHTFRLDLGRKVPPTRLR